MGLKKWKFKTQLRRCHWEKRDMKLVNYFQHMPQRQLMHLKKWMTFHPMERIQMGQNGGRRLGLSEDLIGLTCRWMMTRGVSVVEWQEKFWEAAEFDYKELGSEKSGRDANGNVWREF
ncbi:hypothetical protein HS088_TW01G00249 [Tripterygium wilfordii]|uniref:Uncharacterized protein n=1 Tax=Tripterygium wilfordii TaxID=458696 RepID=A0A7J7E1D8_TRIWF|nr:hypothetical protein HS088_TW01G00249 [Tripterygium wilfordii]